MTCEGCGAVLTELVNAYRKGAPQPGDFLVCTKCGAFLVYDLERLRVLSSAEFGSLDASDQRALEGVRRMAIARLGGIMRRNRWIIGSMLLACCSGGASSAVEDAGRLLVDAGEMLSDAGAALADSGQAHAAVDIPCDLVVQRTIQGTGQTLWYAETTVAPDADIDAWLCDVENFGPPTVPCTPENDCTGDEPPRELACHQTSVQMEGGTVRAYCGSRVVFADGGTSGQRYQTMRLRVR